MIKQLIALIVLSILIILTMSYTQQVVGVLMGAHDWVSQILTDVFSDGKVGNLARGLIALLTMPALIALIPTAIYWIIRRHWFPYFMETIWVVWLIQAGALVVYKAVV